MREWKYVVDFSKVNYYLEMHAVIEKSLDDLKGNVHKLQLAFENGAFPQELENELLPEELKKHRNNPANGDGISLLFSESDQTYGEDTYYVTYTSRSKKHKFTMFCVEGKWKVDISYLWMGDWYDWMPGY